MRLFCCAVDSLTQVAQLRIQMFSQDGVCWQYQIQLGVNQSNKFHVGHDCQCARLYHFSIFRMQVHCLR